MTEISILEFAVYGLICYTGVIMLIISAFKETPTGKSQSLVRAMWLIPSVFTAFMLASAGVDITLESGTVTNTITSLNSSEVWTEAITSDTKFTLLEPVWTTLHYMLAAVMLVYVILQMLTLLTKV